MEHDALRAAFVAPDSCEPSHLAKAYSANAYLGMEAANDLISGSDLYSSNSGGHFAWDLAPFIRAGCLLWRSTGEMRPLQLAAEWAELVSRSTDREIGTADWRGRRGAAWSAGSRYTPGIASVPLGEVGERATLQSAGADHVEIELLDESTARVRALKDGAEVWAPPAGSLVPGGPDYLPDVLSLHGSVAALQFRRLPVSGDLRSLRAGVYALSPQSAPHLVHTGLIARALLEVASAVEASPGGGGTGVDPDMLRGAAADAVAVHRDDLLVEDGVARYVIPSDFPGRRVGLVVPHNQSADIATCHLILGDLSGDPFHRRTGRSLIAASLRELDRAEGGESARAWNYYPVESDSYAGIQRAQPEFERTVRGAPRSEDSSHALMRITALLDWRDLLPESVTDHVMALAAETFHRSFVIEDEGRSTLRYLPGEDRTSPNRGRCDSYAGVLAGLAPWSAPLGKAVDSLACSAVPESIFGATLLSIARLHDRYSSAVHPGY